MKVEMKCAMEGTSESRAIGDIVDVSADEGKRLIAAGFAKQVGKPDGSKANNSAGK